ncbi:MAG: hypothetical protein AAF845_16485 [Bacteroidota bacterium]
MGALTDRVIARQERALGVDLDYLRSLAEASTATFAKFGAAMPAAQHRAEIPVTLWHLARLAATRVQDCGTCVQIVVNQARADGVPAAALQSALDDDGRLTHDERLVMRYGEAVAARAADVPEAVEAVRARFGESGLTELALAVTMVQVFPILKRGLGQDIACALVELKIES